MEDNSQQHETATPPAARSEPAPGKKSKKWLVIISVVVLVLGLLAFGIVQVMSKVHTSSNNSTGATNAQGSSAAANKLYDALGNAVGQQKVRVGMWRATYANRADANAGQHKGSEQASLSAMDTTTLTYANVFATNINGEGHGYSVGRCANKVPYLVGDSEVASITSLAVAAERLKRPLSPSLPHLVTDSCSEYGMAPGAIAALAWARLSDGIMPVTLETAQAKDWAEKMKGTSVFAVTDAGTVTKDGKALRKYTFTPKINSDQVGVTLQEIFKQASHVDQLKQQTGATYDYAFIPLSATLASGAEGFYLIDEKTNLPVYSEINSISPDMTLDDKAPSRLNLARTKFSYSYGQPVDIDLNTPLEIVQ